MIEALWLGIGLAVGFVAGMMLTNQNEATLRAEVAALTERIRVQSDQLQDAVDASDGRYSNEAS